MIGCLARIVTIGFTGYGIYCAADFVLRLWGCGQGVEAPRVIHIVWQVV